MKRKKTFKNKERVEAKSKARGRVEDDGSRRCR